MKAKRILSIAIIAALPFGANATDPVGPSAVPSNGTPVVATASAPYQTVTPVAHADEHIASTKYVIGAYNDAIAAVNKVNSDKQNKIMTFVDGQNVPIDPYVEQVVTNQALTIPSSKAVRDAIDEVIDNTQDKFILASNGGSVNEVVLDKPEFSNEIRNGSIANMVSEDYRLVTAGAVADVFASQRATIYTTWDTNATTQVPLTFVPAQQ